LGHPFVELWRWPGENYVQVVLPDGDVVYMIDKKMPMRSARIAVRNLDRKAPYMNYEVYPMEEGNSAYIIFRPPSMEGTFREKGSIREDGSIRGEDAVEIDEESFFD